MLIGIFNSTKEAKQWIDSHSVSLEPGNRIICTGTEQTTYERYGDGWKNINGIYLKGEKGQDGSDGKNGRDAKEVDEGMLLNKLTETIKLDKKFQEKIKGEKGDRGEKGEKGMKGEKGETPDSEIIINSIYEKLKADKNFISQLKGKDGYAPVKGKDYFDGKDGEPGKTPVAGEDFPMPMDGLDGTRWVLIEDVNKIILNEGEWGIDLQRNIYIKKNGHILKL